MILSHFPLAATDCWEENNLWGIGGVSVDGIHTYRHEIERFERTDPHSADDTMPKFLLVWAWADLFLNTHSYAWTWSNFKAFQDYSGGCGCGHYWFAAADTNASRQQIPKLWVFSRPLFGCSHYLERDAVGQTRPAVVVNLVSLFQHFLICRRRCAFISRGSDAFGISTPYTLRRQVLRRQKNHLNILFFFSSSIFGLISTGNFACLTVGAQLLQRGSCHIHPGQKPRESSLPSSGAKSLGTGAQIYRPWAAIELATY